MTTQLHQYDRSRGSSRSLAFIGDSLTQGAGSTNGFTMPYQAGLLLPKRVISNFGIGGQTWQQIAARQGATPSFLTLTGNAFNGAAAVSVTNLSVQLLSTGADTTTRSMSGVLAGIPCILTRTAPGSVETYAITPLFSTTLAVPAGTPFYPDDWGGLNSGPFINVFWWGRNNVPTFTGLNAAYDAAIASLPTPRRFIIIGVLNSTAEPIGSGNYNAIAAQNASIQAAYSDNFIPSTPPTTVEMASINYTPTAQDLTDIANGYFPTAMHANGDQVHLNNIGYSIIALRVAQLIQSFNW